MDGPLGSAPEAAWGRSSAAGLTASLGAVSSTPPQEFPEHPGGGTVSIRHHNSRRLSEAKGLRGEGQVSLYAKGRVLGKWLLTLAYDTDKDNERLRNPSLTINANATKGGSARQESTSAVGELRRDLPVPSFGWRHYHLPEHSSQR